MKILRGNFQLLYLLPDPGGEWLVPPREPVEVEELVVVHPDHGHPQRVVGEHVDVCAPGVGAPRAEHVAHARARHDLDAAAAHPLTEGHLQVLPTPDFHA